MEWVDGNLGSKVTIKYPAVYLLGRGARADILSVAFAGAGQSQDAGGKVIHIAPDTTSTITSKSISKDGGQATYRGLLKVAKGAVHTKSFVRCDALLLDEQSRSDTYPSIEIDEEQADIGHQATVSRLSDERVFYLQSRGLTETEAKALIVNGFFDQFTRELPMTSRTHLPRTSLWQSREPSRQTEPIDDHAKHAAVTPLVPPPQQPEGNTVMGIITWIVLGLIAGWLASRFMRGGYGIVGHTVRGIGGAIVGGYVGGLVLGRDLMVTGFDLDSVLVAFLGAVVLIAVSRMFTGRRVRT